MYQLLALYSILAGVCAIGRVWGDGKGPTFQRHPSGLVLTFGRAFASNVTECQNRTIRGLHSIIDNGVAVVVLIKGGSASDVFRKHYSDRSNADFSGRFANGKDPITTRCRSAQ
jgi:hypothetical protein